MLKKKLILFITTINNKFEVEELCQFLNKYYCNSRTFHLIYNTDDILKSDSKVYCIKFLNRKIIGSIRKKYIGENMYYIDLLCIHPLFRHCGLAKELIDRCYVDGGSGMFTIDKCISINERKKNWITLNRSWKKYWIEIQGNQNKQEWILHKLPLQYKNLDVYEFQGISKSPGNNIENMQHYILVTHRKCIKGKWNLFSEETIYCDKTFDIKINFQPISF